MTITATKLTSFAGVAAVAAAKVASVITAVGYLVGGLLFGVALFRARFVARWAALLLAVGSVITILTPVLPHAFERLLAIPMGAALTALGFSLWSRQRNTAVPAQPTVGTPFDPVTSR